MSRRAACRLIQLGASEVFDYAGGKLDWLAHGLDYDGDADLVGRHLADVATGAPDERVDAVASRVGGDNLCVVVAEDRTVLAVLTEHALLDHRDAIAGEVASFGPTTVRPSEERHRLDERMAAKDVTRILVTDPSGRLLGLYRR